METIGIFSLDPTDIPLRRLAIRATDKIDPQIAALFAPGEIPVRSNPVPARAKSWYWGLTFGARAHPQVWIHLNHPYVDELYTLMHEPFHCLINLLRVAGKAQPLITELKAMTGTPATKGFDEGIYTAKLCTVPEEYCADVFAKAQAPGALSPVLPHFYHAVTPILPDRYTEFLNVVATLGKR